MKISLQRPANTLLSLSFLDSLEIFCLNIRWYHNINFLYNLNLKKKIFHVNMKEFAEAGNEVAYNRPEIQFSHHRKNRYHVCINCYNKNSMLFFLLKFSCLN